MAINFRKVVIELDKGIEGDTDGFGKLFITSVDAGLVINNTTSKVKVYAVGEVFSGTHILHLKINDEEIPLTSKAITNRNNINNIRAINDPLMQYLGEYTLPTATNGQTSIDVEFQATNRVTKMRAILLFEFNNDPKVYFHGIMSGSIIMDLPFYETNSVTNAGYKMHTPRGSLSANLVNVDDADIPLRIKIPNATMGFRSYLETTNENYSEGIYSDLGDDSYGYLYNDDAGYPNHSIGSYQGGWISFNLTYNNVRYIKLYWALLDGNYVGRTFRLYTTANNGSSWSTTSIQTQITDYDEEHIFEGAVTSRTVNGIAIVPTSGSGSFEFVHYEVLLVYDGEHVLYH